MKYRRMRAVGAALAVLFLLLLAAPTAQGATRAAPRLALWVELPANLIALSTRGGMAAMLDRAKAAGVTAIIPEAKNAWGFVAYESTVAPHIRTSTVPRTLPPEYPPPASWFPRDYDPLRVIIEEAHARGIEVHAAVNVFAEGLNVSKVGIAFERPQWQTWHVAGPDRVVPASDVGTLTFVNPALPEVQLYELAIIAEIVERYDVDGVVLDRIRYPDITADFSEVSREQFEQWLGWGVEGWPDSVLQIQSGRAVRGPMFPQWVAWRATVIQQFIRAAEHVVHGIKPTVAFAAYVGAWYPQSWNEGVNWAAASFTPPYDWVTPEWQRAAVAELFDYLLVGLYYSSLSPAEAALRGLPGWMSVEGGAQLAREVVQDVRPVLGSLLLTSYEGSPDRFQAALQKTRELTSGVMLFDLTYLERYDWWPYLQSTSVQGLTCAWCAIRPV